MNLTILEELALFSQELQRCLSPDTLQILAREVGFVQRNSKYGAQDIVALCVWLSQEVASTSLTQLCSCLESSTGVLISLEGLNQRFNTAAVEFLQLAIEQDGGGLNYLMDRNFQVGEEIMRGHGRYGCNPMQDTYMNEDAGGNWMRFSVRKP